MEKQKVFEKRNIYRNDDSGKVFLFCLLAYFLFSLFISMIAGKITEARDVEVDVITSSVGYVVASYVGLFAVYVLTIFGYNKINKISFKAVNLKFKMPWKTYLILIAVGVVSLLGVNYFITATDNFLELIGYPIKESLPVINPTSAPTYLLAILLVAVFPAVYEELIFRGVVLQGLRSRFSDCGAILLSGLLFALMHFNLQQLAYPFILGCVMGWIVIRTGSLVSSMIVHFVNNFLIVTFAFIENMTGFSLELPNTWWFYILAIALLGVTFGILWLVEKCYFKRKSTNLQERTSQKTSIYVYLSLGISAFMFIIITIIGFVSNGIT